MEARNSGVSIPMSAHTPYIVADQDTAERMRAEGPHAGVPCPQCGGIGGALDTDAGYDTCHQGPFLGPQSTLVQKRKG